MKIGILSLQGDFQAHGKVLQELGVHFTYITEPQQLSEVSGLIMPGGESTTMIKLMREENFLTAIQDFVKKGGYTFGTCAGAILLAKEVKHPEQASLGLLDVTVERNAYGRQLGSHIGIGEIDWPQSEMVKNYEMIFIRAPKITRVGKDVTTFATYENSPVGVMSDRCFITTFHPELTQDYSIHQYFIKQITAVPSK